MSFMSCNTLFELNICFAELFDQRTRLECCLLILECVCFKEYSELFRMLFACYQELCLMISMNGYFLVVLG